MPKPIKVAALCGSLRKQSYNAGLLNEAMVLKPANMILEKVEIGHLPLFNQDFETDPPAEVKELKRAVKSADAILFVSPEHNYSIPGILKNAIDWASRPFGDNSFDGKPAAIMGASIGQIATARMQYHLRQAMVYLNMHPLNSPEVMVGVVQDKLDSAGRLKDEKTKQKIRELLDALVVWTEKLKDK